MRSKISGDFLCNVSVTTKWKLRYIAHLRLGSDWNFSLSFHEAATVPGLSYRLGTGAARRFQV